MSRLTFSFLLITTYCFAEKQSNFVFFLVDDMGMMDIGTYGSTFHETPNIDKLAKTGMKFNNGYAACPVCSPTRASIMTGRHPVRVDITDWIPGQSNKKTNKLLHPEDRDNLALEEVTSCGGTEKPWLPNFLRRQVASRKWRSLAYRSGIRHQYRWTPSRKSSRWVLRSMEKPGLKSKQTGGVPDRTPDRGINSLYRRARERQTLPALSLVL